MAVCSKRRAASGIRGGCQLLVSTQPPIESERTSERPLSMFPGMCDAPCRSMRSMGSPPPLPRVGSKRSQLNLCQLAARGWSGGSVVHTLSIAFWRGGWRGGGLAAWVRIPLVSRLALSEQPLRDLECETAGCGRAATHGIRAPDGIPAHGQPMGSQHTVSQHRAELRGKASTPPEEACEMATRAQSGIGWRAELRGQRGFESRPAHEMGAVRFHGSPSSRAELPLASQTTTQPW